MKADDIKTANRSGRKLPCILAAFITWLLPALLLILTTESSQADSATWLEDPFNGDWNFIDLPTNLSNWSTPGGFPNGPTDTATFATSNIHSVFLSADTEVNGVVFNPGASAYTITAGSGFNLTISGAGIMNNSGVAQIFRTTGDDPNGAHGIISFTNSATAGNATIRNAGGTVNGASGGATQFFDTSTA